MRDGGIESDLIKELVSYRWISSRDNIRCLRTGWPVMSFLIGWNVCETLIQTGDVISTVQVPLNYNGGQIKKSINSKSENITQVHRRRFLRSSCSSLFNFRIVETRSLKYSFRLFLEVSDDMFWCRDRCSVLPTGPGRDLSFTPHRARDSSSADIPSSSPESDSLSGTSLMESSPLSESI